MKLRARLNNLTSAMGRTTVSFDTGSDPADIEKYKDKDLDLEIKVHRDRRSLDANACLWACLGELAGELGFTNWEMYLLELKAYGQFTQVRIPEAALCSLQAHWREVEVVGDETVTEEVENAVTGYTEEQEVRYLYVNCYYGSHTYNTKEFSRLLTGVMEDMKAAGLTPPPSEDMRRMLRDMEQREKDKQNKGD